MTRAHHAHACASLAPCGSLAEDPAAASPPGAHADPEQAVRVRRPRLAPAAAAQVDPGWSVRPDPEAPPAAQWQPLSAQLDSEARRAVVDVGPEGLEAILRGVAEVRQ